MKAIFYIVFLCFAAATASAQQGVPLSAPIVPNNPSDINATHLAKYGKGGYRSVKTISERNAIPAERRDTGMVVFVVDSLKDYRLEGGILNANWQEVIAAKVFQQNDSTIIVGRDTIVFVGIGGSGGGGGTTLNGTGFVKMSGTAPSYVTSISQSEVTNLTTDLAGKQATLVSGTNIKTVNGTTLLGSGNITIEGGGTPLIVEQINDSSVKLNSDTLVFVAANAGSGGTAGVTTFNGRTGSVSPQAGDYSAFYRPLSYVPAWTEVTGKPTTFTPSAHTHALADLLDFNIVSPTNGSVLKFNGTSGKWEVGSDNTGSGDSFFSGDGTATGNRNHNFANYNLQITGLGSLYLTGNSSNIAKILRYNTRDVEISATNQTSGKYSAVLTDPDSLHVTTDKMNIWGADVAIKKLAGHTGTMSVNVAADGTLTKVDAVSNAAVSLATPAPSENILLFYTTKALTITNVQEALYGSSPSVTYTLGYSSTRNGTLTNIVASHAATSTGGASATLANTAIPANSYIILTTSATSGTVNDFNVTMSYKQ